MSRITEHVPGHRRLFSAMALFAIGPIVLVNSTSVIWAQTQAAKTASNPAFEVVSVKASGALGQLPPDGSGKSFFNIRPFRYSGQRLEGSQTLLGIIQEAYSVEDWEVRCPSWMTTSTYAILALAPPGTDRKAARVMLQKVLAERFGMQFHRETKSLPVYALVAGKRGFTLHGRAEREPFKKGSRFGPGEFDATNTLDGLCVYFRSYTDSQKPVINMTGIEGVYHILVKWTPDDNSRTPLGGYNAGFWAALEQQVGLKLEKRDQVRDILVIDKANRVPTAN